VVRATASLQGFLRWQTALALSPALPAGEPRVKTPELIDSAFLELGCPRLAIRILILQESLPGAVVQQGCCTVVVRCRDPRLSIRQHHSPLSVGCKGRISPLANPQTAALGAVGRGGLAVARKLLQCQQLFSESTWFSGSPEAAPSSPPPIRWHLAPENRPNHQSRSSRPARTARQYPMLDALYISNSTNFILFVVGLDGVPRLHVLQL